MTLLAVLSMLAAVALLATLAYFVTHIVHVLEAIGAREPSSSGRTGQRMSYLARISFGVRAIEKQVSALPPQATHLNDTLAELAQGMNALEQSLGGALEAIERQRR